MVSNYLQLLAKTCRGKLDKEEENYIDIAVSSAKRMKGLIEDLLSFSKTLQVHVTYEPTDCSALLEGVLRELGPAIEEGHAQITCDRLPTVLSNQKLLAQVFQNLLSNAIKFRGKEDPKIYISAMENNGEWIFSVKDNGIGIEKKYMDQIFVIFQRLHGTDRPGTGIGLALCKKIVEKFRGRIWVESEPGEGSTFHFTIPAPSAQASE